jgi:hypothetical protein
LLSPRRNDAVQPCWAWRDRRAHLRPKIFAVDIFGYTPEFRHHIENPSRHRRNPGATGQIGPFVAVQNRQASCVWITQARLRVHEEKT